MLPDSVTIDYTYSDFAAYFGESILKHPTVGWGQVANVNDSGNTVFRSLQRKVGGQVFLTEGEMLPMQDFFSWDILKPPQLGWALSYTGVPVYVLRKAVRQKRKGIRMGDLLYVEPKHITSVLLAGGRRTDRCLVRYDDAFYGVITREVVGFQDAVDAVSAGEVPAKLVSPQLAVMVNFGADMDEYPCLVAGGPHIIAKARKDGSILQIGDTDVSDFFV